MELIPIELMIFSIKGIINENWDKVKTKKIYYVIYKQKMTLDVGLEIVL